MKVKSFFNANPGVEIDIVDMYYQAWKQRVKVKVGDVEELMKRLTEEGISPVLQPNAMAIYNYFR